MKKDTLYRNPLSKVLDFTFDSEVTDVFDDMIRRSVPGYNSITKFLSILSKYYADHNTSIYDLGCSLGSSSAPLINGASRRNCKFFLIDSSKDMIKSCKNYISPEFSKEKINFICQDIRKVKIKNASIVALNFSLQFIPIPDRNKLIFNIFNGMKDGGIIILSEKIKYDDFNFNKEIIEKHNNFKMKNGYSPLEISQKKEALKNILHTETIKNHHQRLSDTGFHTIQTWFKHLNFTSTVAIK